MEATRTEKRDDLYLPFDSRLSAPLYHNKSEIWFDFDDVLARVRICSDSELHKAFISKVVNHQIYPIVPEWASFVTVGSIVSVLADRLLIPRQEKMSVSIDRNLELDVWEALWYSLKEVNGKLSPDLLGFILRLFFPRECRDEHDNLYRISNFCSNWPFFCIGFNNINVGGHIRYSLLREGNEIFEKLPQYVKNDIQKICERIPVMLKIVFDYLKTRAQSRQ